MTRLGLCQGARGCPLLEAREGVELVAVPGLPFGPPALDARQALLQPGQLCLQRLTAPEGDSRGGCGRAVMTVPGQVDKRTWRDSAAGRMTSHW